MQKHQTKEEVLASMREQLGGRGLGLRVANIAHVSKIAGAKWLREGIPRERVSLFAAMTGRPEYMIRPDLFVPPVPRSKCQTESHQ